MAKKNNEILKTDKVIDKIVTLLHIYHFPCKFNINQNFILQIIQNRYIPHRK